MTNMKLLKLLFSATRTYIFDGKNMKKILQHFKCNLNMTKIGQLSLYQLVLGSLHQQIRFPSRVPGHDVSPYHVIMPKMLDRVRESLKMTGKVNDVAFLQFIQAERRVNQHLNQNYIECFVVSYKR